MSDREPPGVSAWAAGFVPVAVTERSGFQESVHYGVVVVLGRDGSVEWSAGDPDVVIYPRSSLKPLQAASMVAAGLDLDDRLLAVVCASHDGRPEHVAAVAEILAGVGLDRRICATRRPCRSIRTPASPRCGPASRRRRSPRTAAESMRACSPPRSSTGGRPPATADADHPVQLRIVDDLRRAVGPDRARRCRRVRCPGGDGVVDRVGRRRAPAGGGRARRCTGR